MVYLLKKNKPEWQRGLWNGIGGKIEKDETPLEAICREVFEESGYTGDFNYYAYMSSGMESNDPFECYVYSSVIDKFSVEPFTREKEIVAPFLVSTINTLETIPNLNWLIPAGLDSIKNKNSFNLLQALY